MRHSGCWLERGVTTMTAKAPEIFRRLLAEVPDIPIKPGAADEVLRRVMLDQAERGFT